MPFFGSTKIFVYLEVKFLVSGEGYKLGLPFTAQKFGFYLSKYSECNSILFLITQGHQCTYHYQTEHNGMLF